MPWISARTATAVAIPHSGRSSYFRAAHDRSRPSRRLKRFPRARRSSPRGAGLRWITDRKRRCTIAGRTAPAGSPGERACRTQGLIVLPGPGVVGPGEEYPGEPARGDVAAVGAVRDPADDAPPEEGVESVQGVFWRFGDRAFRSPNSVVIPALRKALTSVGTPLSFARVRTRSILGRVVDAVEARLDVRVRPQPRRDVHRRGQTTHVITPRPRRCLKGQHRGDGSPARPGERLVPWPSRDGTGGDRRPARA